MENFLNMPKIAHYRNKCIGCNSCVEQDSSRWSISEKDGKSVLQNGKGKRGVYIAIIREDERAANERAAKDCPVNIIKILN